MSRLSKSLISASVSIVLSLLIIVEILSGKTPDDSLFAWMLFGNLGVGLTISLITRFSLRGISWAFLAMAGGQLCVAAMSLELKIGSPAVVVAVNAIVAIFFAMAGWFLWRGNSG